MNLKRIIIILVHALIGWGLCGAIMFLGIDRIPIPTLLIVHAIGAFFIFGITSWIYHKKFNYTSPLTTAIIFTAFVILIDFFVVALLIEKNFDMFKDPMGTWIVFIIIFIATYIVGRLVKK